PGGVPPCPGDGPAWFGLPLDSNPALAAAADATMSTHVKSSALTTFMSYLRAPTTRHDVPSRRESKSEARSSIGQWRHRVRCGVLPLFFRGRCAFLIRASAARLL